MQTGPGSPLIIAPGKIAVTDADRFKKTHEYLRSEFLTVEKYLSHSVVKEHIFLPFNPNENEWKQIIAQIKDFV